nr:MAG TPA: hypothetical protein [Microviridae sp.]
MSSWCHLAQYLSSKVLGILLFKTHAHALNRTCARKVKKEYVLPYNPYSLRFKG